MNEAQYVSTLPIVMYTKGIKLKNKNVNMKKRQKKKSICNIAWEATTRQKKTVCCSHVTFTPTKHYIEIFCGFCIYGMKKKNAAAAA